MARNRARSGRALVWLAVVAALVAGLNWASVAFGSGSWTPQLALDLEGGTQIVLEPQVAEGEQVTQEQLDQAVSIIRQRIDASGVSESEITTQGGQNIVVSLPGTPDEATLQRIQASAKMEFRPVLVVAEANAGDPAATEGPAATEEPASTDEPEATETPESSEGSEGGAASPSPTADPEDPAATEDPASTDDPASTEEPADDGEGSGEPEDPSDLAWVTDEVQAEFDAFQCSDVDTTVVHPADEPLVTCSTDGTLRYILGPVEVEGADIANAASGQATSQNGTPTGEWAVNLEFDGEGSEAFHDVTSRITSLESPRNQFAVVLDGMVLIAPTSNAVITNGEAQITGGFTQADAASLADQLKFGSLPIGFQLQSQDTISATLGESQLRSGLLAGLIGLLLVVLYSIFQYRALALVTLASLAIAGGLTYLTITWLSSTEGYRLSLAGVAGLIVAIGITADSFIVYFERVRDELRDGRMLVSAVEAGWRRAIRTIIASDAVNFLAAIVLFLLAVGSVRGFAFTLGITTIIDLIVVACFTHPMLQLLARTRFFSGGHPASGLDPDALGAVYRGRAQFRAPAAAGKDARSAREAQRRQSIAERKAAEAGRER